MAAELEAGEVRTAAVKVGAVMGEGMTGTLAADGEDVDDEEGEEYVESVVFGMGMIVTEDMMVVVVDSGDAGELLLLTERIGTVDAVEVLL
jgi:hypothetical protein